MIREYETRAMDVTFCDEGENQNLNFTRISRMFSKALQNQCEDGLYEVMFLNKKRACWS